MRYSSYCTKLSIFIINSHTLSSSMMSLVVYYTRLKFSMMSKIFWFRLRNFLLKKECSCSKQSSKLITCIRSSTSLSSTLSHFVSTFMCGRLSYVIVAREVKQAAKYLEGSLIKVPSAQYMEHML